MSKWISVSERLPDSDDDVLVTVEGNIDIGYYDQDTGWFVYDEVYSNNVVAWMPLPKPYEEDTDNE